MSERFEYKNGVIFDNNSTENSYSEYNLNSDEARISLCRLLNAQEKVMFSSTVRERELEKKIREMKTEIDSIKYKASKYKGIIGMLTDIIDELI